MNNPDVKWPLKWPLTLAYNVRAARVFYAPLCHFITQIETYETVAVNGSQLKKKRNPPQASGPNL